MSTSSESGNESTDIDTGSDSDTGSLNSNSNSDNEEFLGNNGASRGKPLQLISLERSNDFEETLQLKLNHNVLESVVATCGDKPLCVIAITGHDRSGKSFMLNCIKESLKAAENEERGNWLGNTRAISGFEWKHGYKRNTEGIWIWSRAFNVVDAEDKEVAVLLLDTQGFNDEGIASAEEISAILGISLLISSTLIVNVIGDIPEECFDWLSPFAKYASLCVTKGLRDPFQKLSFLVRDWTMLFDYQFGGEPGKKYLEKVIRDNSSVGKRLKNGWEEIDCFLMPNIGNNALFNAFIGNPADLNKDFSSRLKAYVNSVSGEKGLEHSKKIFGNEIGADELKGFLEGYVELWNNKAEIEMGLRPESILKTSFEAAGKIKIQRGLEAYREMYRQRKKAACGGYLKNASIDSIHIQGRIKALEAFKQFTLPAEESKQFQRKLEELLDQECKQMKKENEGARTTKISDNVSKACNELRAGLQQRFPFTPEAGVNISNDLVFYEEGVLEETLEEMRRAIETEFLEEFEGEDEEGRIGLKRTINSVLQPITEGYTVKNEENRERAMNSAKHAKDQLKEEYLKEMKDDLDKIPNMEANVLGVFHEKAVKYIEKKFRELSLGSPAYQAKWLEELREEIDQEHEIMELGLESTMAKALKMASEETEKYKRRLEEHAEACEEEEEMMAFHQSTSQVILKKFTVDNPFPRESSKGEMIYGKLENSLRMAFTQVVEEGVVKRRRMEEALHNAGLTAFKIYKEDMEETLNEMEFLGGEHFEMKSGSLREMALNYFDEEIDGITLEDGKIEEAKQELVYKLDEKERQLKTENEQRRQMAFGQADSEIVSALEQYEAKMMVAASKLSSMEELREEHEKWRETLVQQFQEKCQSKNEALRGTYDEKLREGIGESFAGVEDFFNMAKQKENVGFMTALLACQTEYVANMNQEFGNRNGYFSKNDLKELHEKTVKAALRSLPSDCKLSKKQHSELKEKLGKVFERYKERNDLVFRSFQNEEPAIGIDLGTTYCCVAIYMKGKVQIVRNSVSGDIIPSYVRFNPDDTKIFGTPAKDEAYLSPETTIFDAKRIIGRRMDDADLQKDMLMWPFNVVEEGGGPKIEVNGVKYYPEEISSFLLEHLKKEAEATLGCEIKKAVITVPAYFTNGQRDATKKAGELAGFEVLGILNEPTAAAVAYRLDCCYDDKERNILVYDLGGGTFDVAVLKLGKDKIDVLAFDGEGHLGGEDFDENIMTYCAKKFLDDTGFDLFNNKESTVKTVRDDVRRRLRRLKTVCEEKKKALATAPSATVSIAAFEGGEDLIVEVTKKKFEEMNQSLFEKTIAVVDRALVSADLRKEQIDEIVLVGGSTKIPKLQKMLSDHFNGKALNKKINPDQAVAYGAAVQAAIKCAKPDEKIFDFGVIQEVTPMSLGIETASNEFDIIIPKGTKIPTTLKQEYATYKDNQETAWIRIFQGENERRAVDNKLLGDFTLEGIPPNGKGKEVVVVSMHIDANGILSVEAICKSNKGSKKMTVSEENKGIMTNEVKKRLIQERQRT